MCSMNVFRTYKSNTLCLPSLMHRTWMPIINPGLPLECKSRDFSNFLCCPVENLHWRLGLQCPNYSEELYTDREWQWKTETTRKIGFVEDRGDRGDRLEVNGCGMARWLVLVGSLTRFKVTYCVGIIKRMARGSCPTISVHGALPLQRNTAHLCLLSFLNHMHLQLRPPFSTSMSLVSSAFHHGLSSSNSLTPFQATLEESWRVHLLGSSSYLVLCVSSI